MSLPKLRACPICGKEPTWHNGWYDAPRATAGLTVFCECNKLYLVPHPYSLDEAIRDDNLVQTVVDGVARRWEKFCEKEAKKSETRG